MNFEEYEVILNRMLEVSREIQVKQLTNTDEISRLRETQQEIAKQQQENSRAIGTLTENVSNLNVVAQRHEDRLTRLYGYQMTSDSDRLDIMQGINDIKRRLNIIEGQLNAG